MKADCRTLLGGGQLRRDSARSLDDAMALVTVFRSRKDAVPREYRWSAILNFMAYDMAMIESLLCALRFEGGRLYRQGGWLKSHCQDRAQ